MKQQFKQIDRTMSSIDDFISNTKNYLMPHVVGIDDDPFWDKLNNFSNSCSESKSHPPYNIVKLNDSEYKIEMALAGYKKDDLSVTLEDGQLQITGTKEDEEMDTANNSDVEFLYRGISSRKFTRTFKLSEDLVVNKVSYDNGMLTISLHRVIPEEKAKKTIPID